MGHLPHPADHLCLGEVPSLILLTYSRGVEDIKRLEEFLLASEARSSCCLNHLSGDYDAAIWCWTPEEELHSFLKSIGSYNPTQFKVLPIERMNTPVQREQDTPPSRAIHFEERFFFRDNPTRWELRSPAFDRPILSDLAKFYMIIQTRPGWCDRIYAELVGLMDTLGQDRELYDFWTVATYRTGFVEGCVVIAYTRDWRSMQLPILKSLAHADEVQAATYLCLDEPVSGDEPWERSTLGAKSPTIEALMSNAVRAIAGFPTVESEGNALLRLFESVLSQEDVRDKLLTYVPLYWWDLLVDVRTMLRCLLANDSDAIWRLLAQRYINIERELCDKVRRLFGLRDPEGTREVQDRQRDRLILNEIGPVTFLRDSQDLQRILEALSATKNSELRSEKAVLGALLKHIRGMATSDTYMMLGRLVKTISNGIKEGRFQTRKNRYLDFSNSSLMKDWQRNLEALSEDRNRLFHGNVINLLSLDTENRGVWRRFVVNYIKAVPQARLLMYELDRAYEQHYRQSPIMLPTIETQQPV